MAEKAWLTDTDPSTRFTVYTRLNAADVMADPITPLGARRHPCRQNDVGFVP